jgi:glycosyltransferase involved in cell wall biosynthesis
MNPRKVIVITPVKNEEWILRAFLKACSEFADHIVIGDHFSTDASAQIAADFPNVVLVRARTTEFSERDRRNQLLEAARLFGTGNLIISLDADEFFSENLRASKAFETMMTHEVGTHFRFPFFNLSSDLETGWVTITDSVAFIDDGSRHESYDMIHFPRLPKSTTSTVVHLPDLSVLHLQYVDNARMESKHAWYKAWERINFPKKSAIEIFRRYNHMHSIRSSAMIRADSSWLRHLEGLGLDLRDLAKTRPEYWWDREVHLMREEKPTRLFRFIFRDQTGFGKDVSAKLFFAYAQSTQPVMALGTYNPVRLALRVLDRLLGRIWV